MLRRQQEFYFQILQIVDALLLCAALWIAHHVRYAILPENFDISTVTPFGGYAWMLVLILPLGPLILERQGLYHESAIRTYPQSLWAIFKSVLYLLILLIIFIVSLRIPQETISRAALFMFLPVSTMLLGFREFLFRWYLSRGDVPDWNRQHVMLCGEPCERDQWRKELDKVPGQHFVISAEMDLKDCQGEGFTRRLHDANIDVAVFSIEHTDISDIRRSLLACEAEGIEAWISADFFRTAIARPQFDRFGSRPLLVFRSTPEASMELMIKRLLDVFVSGVMLLLLFPLWLLLGIGIVFSSGRPIIFSQKRSGLNGRPFTMFKFRTMVTDAEQRREELSEQNEMSGPVFKVSSDPRITPFGHWLRRTSLDEMPQLWNVLRGEMSLVGPRPLPLYETERFDDFSQRRRMSVKPGLTCLWQISGRNQISDFEEWVRLDLDYIDRWTLWLDFKILIKTIPVLLFGDGAK